MRMLMIRWDRGRSKHIPNKFCKYDGWEVPTRTLLHSIQRDQRVLLTHGDKSFVMKHQLVISSMSRNGFCGHFSVEDSARIQCLPPLTEIARS
jgi:hypothetical protein